MKIIYGNLDVKRIDRSDIYKYINDKESFIYDIGNGKYDHHTKECKEYRNNGSPYASFGKIVRDTYKLVGFDYNTYKTFDYFFITPIDTVDNEGPNSVISQHSDVIRATNLSFDFAIMDILEENPDGISWFSLTSDSNSTKHDNHLENYVNKGIDKKSVKPKLEKLANTGIIEFFENGEKIRKVNTRQIKQLLSSTEVKQAIQFASKTSPLGVIGSYILDNLKTVDSESLNTPIHYKHHFIFNSIDYEIMYILMDAITNKNTVEIETERYGIKTVVPLKLYISTQTGRTYIIFWDLHESILFSENLEKILAAKQLEICSEYESYISKLSEIESNIWGVAFKKENTFDLEHVRFVLEYSPEEESYIPSRIRKEAVTGNVSDIDESHIEFTADLIDSKEMIPWIRSFFCRITDIDFPYSNRIKEDISLLSQNKYHEDVVSSFLNQSNYESQIESEITPLFNPIYSTYYLISGKLIEKYVKSQRTPIRLFPKG